MIANANEIASQIFGRTGMRMIGAHTLLSHGDGLSFKFKGSPSFNYCLITLMPDDTYTVKIGRIRKDKLIGVVEHEGVYCDMLGPIFEDATKLALTF